MKSTTNKYPKLLRKFRVGEVALDPQHFGRYGQGGLIVTGFRDARRNCQDDQLLSVKYLETENGGRTYNDSTTRGKNGTNKGFTWASGIHIRFNSTVDVNAKRIRVRKSDYASRCVTFDVLETAECPA